MDKIRIDTKTLKALFEQIKSAYNTSVVAKEFCSQHQDIEEIANITPIIELLHQKLDVSYATLIDTQE